MSAPKTVARVAGTLYLLMFLFSFFATGVRDSIVVRGDAAATAGNIRESTTLFRMGILSDLLQITCFLLAYLALYVLLRHADELAAAAMVVFAAVSVGIYGLNLLNLVTATNVATDGTYAQALGDTGSNALTELYASRFASGYVIPDMFFGLLLLSLAYLVIRSRYFHVALGALIVLGGVGYIADTCARALVSGYGTGVTPLLIPGALAEALLALWLVLGFGRSRAAATGMPQARMH